ncbi:hypothetical protein NP493_1034g00007 [Ridgeia piscesae]|uniref:Fibrinogen C-terminal domain-containing protein n=1 Tax=Ridgeia piscesae TaxID=27915 RepID=A0AAD9KIF6_RIDPI|nr:hypothetical protein NP493_1034g00007 [Ridgeia piscesae]
MCTSVCPVSLLALVVVAFVVHPAPVVCQCTTGHCHDDGDNDVSVLTAMVSRLQDTVEQLQGQIQRQINDTAEQLLHKLQQQLSDATDQQLNQLTKLTDTLVKQETFSLLAVVVVAFLVHPAPVVCQCTTGHCHDDGDNDVMLKRHFRPRDCYDLLRDGHNASGVYEVYLAKARKFVRVFCDMDSNDGGWLVFQRRQDGSVDFYRDWGTYKKGFGDVNGEFWLGNDYLNDITSQGQYLLRIDMEDFTDESRYAVYSNFAVGAEIEKYKLTLGTYSGTAGDSLTIHHRQSFSTRDRDNDANTSHCAQVYKGGWWYAACHYSNLNGLYLRGHHDSYADGIEWHAWHGYHYSLKKVEMKLRPL